MAFKVGLLPLAIIELEESSGWYERRQDGLGKQFLEIVKRSLITISLSPEIFPKTKGKYREVVIDTFPYVIVYEVIKNKNTINVLHIFHTSRNPKLKYKRN